MHPRTRMTPIVGVALAAVAAGCLLLLVVIAQRAAFESDPGLGLRPVAPGAQRGETITFQGPASRQPDASPTPGDSLSNPLERLTQSSGITSNTPLDTDDGAAQPPDAGADALVIRTPTVREPYSGATIAPGVVTNAPGTPGDDGNELARDPVDGPAGIAKRVPDIFKPDRGGDDRGQDAPTLTSIGEDPGIVSLRMAPIVQQDPKDAAPNRDEARRGNPSATADHHKPTGKRHHKPRSKPGEGSQGHGPQPGSSAGHGSPRTAPQPARPAKPAEPSSNSTGHGSPRTPPQPARPAKPAEPSSNSTGHGSPRPTEHTKPTPQPKPAGKHPQTSKGHGPPQPSKGHGAAGSQKPKGPTKK